MPLNAICLVPGLARLNLEQHLPALAAMDGSSQGKCDSDNNSDNNSSNSRCKRDVGSETPIIRPNLEGEFTGWDASPCCYTLLFFFGRLLPAAPIPIPTSSKREPSNRRKLLPSWRGLMSYRGDGLGPGQRATHSSAGAAPHAPPLPFRSKAAASGETGSICHRYTGDSRVPEVRNLGRHPPSSARAGPDSAASRMVIAPLPVIPSWELARGKVFEEVGAAPSFPTLPLTRQAVGKHRQRPQET